MQAIAASVCPEVRGIPTTTLLSDLPWLASVDDRSLNAGLVEPPVAGPSPVRPGRLRWVPALAIAVAVAVVLGVAGTALWLTGSQSPVGPTPCAGTATYSGTVTDAAHRGLNGVIVTLSPVALQDGKVTSVPTNDTGGWSATVSGGCAYRASLYWQSSAEGPLLAYVSDLPRSSVVPVNVTEEAVSLVLFREFSHSSNVTISVEISSGVRFSVDARATGNIPLGFLGVNAAGRPGADFALANTMGTTAAVPYAFVYTRAKAFRVADVDGDFVVYVVPTAKGRFQFSEDTEYLAMEEAILRAEAADVYPYIQIAGRGISTYWWDFMDGTGVPLVQNASAFGTELRSTFTVGNGSRAKFTVTITNDGASNDCYVMYIESLLEFHLWYYSTRCA